MFTREDGTREKILREMWPAAFPPSVKTAIMRREEFFVLSWPTEVEDSCNTRREHKLENNKQGHKTIC